METTARAVRLLMIVLPTAIVLAAVGSTTAIAVAAQERSIRAAAADRVQEVAASLAVLDEVVVAVEGAADAGTPTALADAADLGRATAALQPLADLVEGTGGVEYVVVTDDEGVRITHPDPAERGEQVLTTNASVLAGDAFLGTETGPSGTTLRAKVPVVGDDGEVVGMVAVGVLESTIAADREEALSAMLPWVLAALVVATAGSSLLGAAVERRLRRADELRTEHEQSRRVAPARREQSHEFSTRLHVIHGLVSHGDAAEALDYIDGIVPALALGAEPPPAAGPRLDAAAAAIRGELAAAGATLEVEGEPGLAVDDGAMLVLSNLCRNAAEAGAVRVRCAVADGGGRMRVVVEDDGPGIDAADADRVLERGHTTKADRSGAGRGIGLDLVRRTAASRDGTILIGRSALGGARLEVEMATTR